MTPNFPPDRRYDLDWIRVGAFALLILYHVGMFYVTWDWHVKSPRQSETLELLMMGSSPWRLSLLFFISGCAVRFMADRLGAGRLVWERTARLLPPLLLAMFVIVPPQSYYELVESLPGWSMDYGAFWLKYASASGHWCDADGCLTTPTWNHMWFVAYLLVYVQVLSVVLRIARRPLLALGRALERPLAGAGLLVWPILMLAVFRMFLAPRFEITHALIDDWYNHALSFSVFLLGFLTVRSERITEGFVRLRWPALLLALTAYAAWATYAWTYRGDDAVPPETLRVCMRVVYAALQWSAIAAILGFARRRLTRGGPVLRYLTEAVFPFYIVHQTITVVAAHHLARLGLPVALEAGLLIAITAGGCLLTFEVVRRVGWLRPLFGLKARPRRQAEPLVPELAPG
ncbi:acyltransferase family protein [Caulobacter sp. 17J65-9]|uniref:acyltransferase family protein n=1 Tax=Caulobacter sp. 17J65-9 TaxID=2709382 RepID=UPI003204735A